MKLDNDRVKAIRDAKIAWNAILLAMEKAGMHYYSYGPVDIRMTDRKNAKFSKRKESAKT